MMNIYFLGGFFPADFRDWIYSKSRGVIQFAADALQQSLISGLTRFAEVCVVNIPFVGSFPLRFRVPFVKGGNFNFPEVRSSTSVGFLNLAIVKFVARYLAAKKGLGGSINGSVARDGWIMVYSMHAPFIFAAVWAKSLFGAGLRICVIVPDIPEFMSGRTSLPYRAFKSLESFLLQKPLKSVDAFVLLTDHMVEKLPIGVRPWVRVEGVYGQDEDFDANQCIRENFFLYTGTLDERYGIPALIEAFEALNAPGFQLWVCGDGDYKRQLISKAKVNKDIKFYGQLPRDAIGSLQRRALALVNPRNDRDEFTRYSFPSKTMEYLASGSITIMNRLPGIPDEYYNYCVTPRSGTVDDLASAMRSVIQMSPARRKKMGIIARDFILQNKSASVQAGRIFHMLQSCK